jgi:hypothetical protein
MPTRAAVPALPHRPVTAAIPYRAAIGSKRRTRPPLADLMGDLKVSDGLTSGGGVTIF